MNFTIVNRILLTQRFYLLLEFRKSRNASLKLHRYPKLHNLERKMRATKPRGKCFDRMRERGLI